ncbi:MAG: pyridoxal-dependent decarboxylase [Myxococcales bacterium]|nr:pyridoxal-dependent decarboxylase [Myxococcales bacterium]
MAHVTLDPSDEAGWARLGSLGHAMLRDMFRHLQQVRRQPAFVPMPDAVRRRLRQLPLPRQGSALEDVYADFKRDVLPFGGGNLHPRFWGWVMGNGSPGGVLAEMLAATLNPNVWGGSHAAVEIEAQVIAWCRQLMGFPEAATGLLTSGCSLANLIGLAAARGRVLRAHGALEDGVRGLPGEPRVYASVEAHNSLERAARLLGFGRSGLRTVPVGEDFRMDPAALRAQVVRDRAAGDVPIAVVATAGTVATGAIDPLDAIADVCAELGLWLHVDGAFGALAVLDPQTAPQLTGLTRADSLAFDFHKWLSVPYEAGCVLVRDGRDHRRPFESDTPYLTATATGPGAGDTWYCDLGPELSRGFRGLKVWMTLREHGVDTFRALVQQSLGHARHLARCIDADPRLELLAPVGLNVVCFRYCGAPGADESVLERVNQVALGELQTRGVAVPSHTRIDGRFAIRAAFVNHRTRLEDIELFVDAFLRAVESAEADGAKACGTARGMRGGQTG